MKDIQLERVLQAKYGNSFTLKELLEDTELQEKFPKALFPHIEMSQNTAYIQMRDTLITKDEVRKLLYIYVNRRGEITASPDLSFCQIPPSWKGYLARFSIPANQKTAHMLSMDYLVNIEKIRYQVPSLIDQQKGNIIYTSSLMVVSEVAASSSNMNWDPIFINPEDKEAFFRKWFE